MLKNLIVQAYTNAVQGGYEDELKAMTPYELAVDLHDRRDDIAQFPFGEILITVIAFVSNGYK